MEIVINEKPVAVQPSLGDVISFGSMAGPMVLIQNNFTPGDDYFAVDLVAIDVVDSADSIAELVASLHGQYGDYSIYKAKLILE